VERHFSPWSGVVTVLSLALHSDSLSMRTGDASGLRSPKSSSIDVVKPQKVGGMPTSTSRDARIPSRSRFKE